MTSLAKVFGEHLADFYDELIKLYPTNNELRAGKTMVDTFKKYNPRKLIECWRNLVARPYGDEVMKGNLNFFMTHDFEKELNYGKWDRKTNEDWMQEIKVLVQTMNEENLKKSIKYFQNLTKICNLYFDRK
jgi:hypothetical protein